MTIITRNGGISFIVVIIFLFTTSRSDFKTFIKPYWPLNMITEIMGLMDFSAGLNF